MSVNDNNRTAGRVISHGDSGPSPCETALPRSHAQVEPPSRRLRRLHRVWPDRDGNISYLLTLCVDGRVRVLDNEDTYQRFVAFLLDSPQRYHWYGRRFVVMPDHLHLIANMGHDAVRPGQWIKALKVVVGGLKRREEIGDDRRPVGSPGQQVTASSTLVGRVPLPGVPVAGSLLPPSDTGSPLAASTNHEHELTRIKRVWRWQDRYHDHKFRTSESESRKWEYVCLNPVRYGLVKQPEEWPYGSEIFYDEAGGPRLVRGTPPIFETGMLMTDDDVETMPQGGNESPGKGTRPTT